jgi:molecular chaperone GrpE (heat shock protein)
MRDPNLFWLGVVLFLACVLFLLTQLGSATRPPTQPPISGSPPSSDSMSAPAQIHDLQQQCLRLRHELHQQKVQLTADVQAAAFEQLQTLLTSYPTARKMAQAKPDLPARNLVALFTPLENLLHDWQIETIGPIWEQVAFDPQLHQPDGEDIATGEPVYVRFIGYRRGDQILCPAKVSRTLPLVE